MALSPLPCRKITGVFVAVQALAPPKPPYPTPGLNPPAYWLGVPWQVQPLFVPQVSADALPATMNAIAAPNRIAHCPVIATPPKVDAGEGFDSVP